MSAADQPAESFAPGPNVATVEALVRRELAKAMGGRRGMIEAGVPTLIFTVLWLSTRNLTVALGASLVCAVGFLIARVVQKSSTQFAINALVGIGIGWFFVYLAARGGGDENDQALAYFLPGIIYSSVYSVLMIVSCVTRWPAVGFMLGSVTGDPTAWRKNPQIVTLCGRLTWLLLMPGLIGVALQGPVWFLGHSGQLDPARAVLILGGLRVGLGWPLRIAALSGAVWLLARNHTPLEEQPSEGPNASGSAPA